MRIIYDIWKKVEAWLISFVDEEYSKSTSLLELTFMCQQTGLWAAGLTRNLIDFLITCRQIEVTIIKEVNHNFLS